MWSCRSLPVDGRFGPVDGNGYHRRMSMHRILAAFALASACALAFIPSPASASDCQPQVQGGWVRLGPAGMPMMAGFGRIENNCATPVTIRSEEHTSELQSLMRISYAVFCLKKKKKTTTIH